jgi:hypothetical protein
VYLCICAPARPRRFDHRLAFCQTRVEQIYADITKVFGAILHIPNCKDDIEYGSV